MMNKKTKIMFGAIIGIPLLFIGGAFGFSKLIPGDEMTTVNIEVGDTTLTVGSGVTTRSNDCQIHLTDNGWSCYGTCHDDLNCYISQDGYCGCFEGHAPIPEGDDYTKGMVGTIYVSNSRWSGAMGGQDGANAKCTTKAHHAGLVGEWKAIVSTSKQSAYDNIGRDMIFYRMDGRLLAMHRIGLFDSQIFRQININELGELNVNEEVWTGSTVAGLDTGFNCNDWTWSLNAEGTIGLSLRMNSGWIDREEKPCEEMKRLYCVRTN